VRILEQVVEQIGVEGILALQLLAEVVAVLLLLGKVERDLGGVSSVELATFLVLLDVPAVWDKRLGIEVDDMAHFRGL
jgi:hypothetical protein